MGLFDKVTNVTKNVGGAIANTAGKVGSNVAVAAQEQQELINLKSQINVIEQELNASYIQIGRKYVEYVASTGEMPGIDVSDILKLIDPKLSKKQDLEKEIIRLEKEIKQKDVLREKSKAEEEFQAEKSKLDKALGMELLTQEEYNAKLAFAQKKLDNFEAIRRVEQQAEMGLISKEEMTQKIKELTES